MCSKCGGLRLIEERIDDAVICPHCQADEIYRHRTTNEQQRCRCKPAKRRLRLFYLGYGL